MKKITDERLILLNLKNIRIAFIIQTIGVLGILGYDAVKKGLEGMTDNPLWLVFMITAVALGYLSMSNSVDHESEKVNPKKSLKISLVVISLISIVVGFLVSRSEGFTIINSVIIGGILLSCALVPVIYTYKLRVKRLDEDMEE
ncbi:hypothetical protein RE628_05835 [Paenibacillus sp. D2_2]|uniref:hypothetical protein n=1 Tax=Paenibacillus sp. D2_2 TaxID=3073092 RepID=UPI002815C506|nr:hypothetical protein [Paenibacillus sp. D2_2]WMT41958.1 hypothetical protein RE628_05835 [Paenibacillus sp. D2_2]